jgi:hydroxymethylpyrimidine/phosphomethylpyrimidine kinase
VVAAQLDAVLDDLPVAAVKVGMIGDPAVAEVIAARAGRLPHLVVDPVLVATTGSRLGGVAGVRPLIPYAAVLTPNRHEAGALVGRVIETAGEMADAAGELVAAGARAVVVTGSELAIDVLRHDGVVETLRGPAVATANDHGSGCTFAAAIAVWLAAGDEVPVAVRKAKRYVAGALRGGRDWRIGAGAGPLDHFGWSA